MESFPVIKRGIIPCFIQVLKGLLNGELPFALDKEFDFVLDTVTFAFPLRHSEDEPHCSRQVKHHFANFKPV